MQKSISLDLALRAFRYDEKEGKVFKRANAIVGNKYKLISNLRMLKSAIKI